MSLYNLDKILKPQSIAVVGATDRPKSLGRSLVQNLIKGGFKGDIYPIHPKKPEIMGIKAFSNLEMVKKPIDCAVICTNIKTVPAIMQQCVDLGIGGTVIISAGGKEVGPEGEALEKEILAIAEKGGVRVVGPNCLGVVSSQANMNASFAHIMANPGNLAFISQSGAVCTSVLDFAAQEQMGFSHFISIGSMLDVDFGDLIDYLGNDPEVKSILLYVEMINNHRKFISAARAVSRVKPIVVLKSGRSQAGAKAAQSHTGSLVGEDAVYDAAFKRAGIVRVDTLGDLFGCAELMAKQPRPKGPRLAIVTNAGGPGVMAADYLASYGLEPAPLSEETFAKLDAICPPIWSKSNPMDLTGAATPETFKKAIDICCHSKDFDAVLIMLPPMAMFSSVEFAKDIADALRDLNFPTFAVWLGGKEMEAGRKILNQSGIPTYPNPEGAIRAFHYMYTYGRNQEMLQEIPSETSQNAAIDPQKAREIVTRALGNKESLLTEVDSKDLLRAYGIPATPAKVAESAEEAKTLAADMGFPVVVKLHSKTITHKSDMGGVILDLRNEKEVGKAFNTIQEATREYDPQAHFGGVTIQPMIRQKGQEVILGVKKDPDFGPVIMFGMGGVMTELFKDRAIGLPPLNHLLARRMIEETKVYRLLKGYRNIAKVNLDQLEEIMVRLSQLVIDLPEIAELDINPLLLTPGWASALDARVMITKASEPSPLHLSISPYPAEYEGFRETKTGHKLFIRPVKPEDAPMMLELFETMSQKSIYNRFLRKVTVLDKDTLVRFTQVDYDRDLALVALDLSGHKPTMVGLTRLSGDPDGVSAEWAIVVGDPWQEQGIGAMLMNVAIETGKKRGLKRLWGYLLAENKGMVALHKRFGSKLTKTKDGKKYQAVYDLNQ